MVGGCAGCFGWSSLDAFFSDSNKAHMGGSDLAEMPNTPIKPKPSLISYKGSELEGGSPSSSAEGSAGSSGSASSVNPTEEPSGSSGPSQPSGSSGPSQPSNQDLPFFEIKGLNIDIRAFNFGSLWPNFIQPGSEEPETLTHPSISKSIIPYNLQSKAQLENLLAHHSYGYPKDGLPQVKEMVWMEVEAEYKRRLFLKKYKDVDPTILKAKAEIMEIERLWDALYLKVGKEGPYRLNWEKKIPESDLFRDRVSSVYLEADLIKISPDATYSDILEGKKKIKYIIEKFELSQKKSQLDLNIAKSSWDEVKAKLVLRDIKAKPAGLDELSKAKKALDEAQAYKISQDSIAKRLALVETQSKKDIDEFKKEVSEALTLKKHAEEYKTFLENESQKAALLEAQIKLAKAQVDKRLAEIAEREAALIDARSQMAGIGYKVRQALTKADLDEAKSTLALKEAEAKRAKNIELLSSVKTRAEQAALDEAKLKKTLAEIQSRSLKRKHEE